MKIQPGKYYQTRGGQKAYVGHILPEEIAEGNSYLVRGCLLKQNGWVQESWCIDGRYSAHDTNHYFDIVAEWTEPKPQQPEFVFLLKYECKNFDGHSLTGSEFFGDKDQALHFVRQQEDQWRAVEYSIHTYRRAND